MDRGTVTYQKEITIQMKNYSECLKVHVLSPSRATKLMMKLVKIVGEPVATMAKVKGDEAKAADILPIAVKALVNRLDEDEVLSIVKELLDTVTQDEKKIMFENFYQGRLGLMVKVVVEVVQVQFGDFFETLLEMMGDGNPLGEIQAAG